MGKLNIFVLITYLFMLDSVRFEVSAAEIYAVPSYCKKSCFEDTSIEKLQTLNVNIGSFNLSEGLYETAMKGLISHRLLMKELFFADERKRVYGDWRACSSQNDSDIYYGVKKEVRKTSKKDNENLKMMFKVQKLLNLITSDEIWKKRNGYIQEIYRIDGDGKNVLPPSASLGINKTNRDFINKRKGLMKRVSEGIRENMIKLSRTRNERERKALFLALEKQRKYVFDLKVSIKQAKEAVEADGPYGINNMDPFLYDFSSFMDNFKAGDHPILEYRRYKRSDFGKDTLKQIKSLKTEDGKSGEDFLATIRVLLNGDDEDKSIARMMAAGMLMDKKIGPMFEREVKDRLREQFEILDANILELCENRHKKKKHHLLHFNKKLVEQYIVSQGPAKKDLLQKAHCKLIETYPLPNNVKASLIGAGMFVAGAALIPFTGHVGMAVIFIGVGTYFSAVGVKDYVDMNLFYKKMNGLREIGMAEVEQVRNIVTEKRLRTALIVLDVALTPVDIAVISSAKKAFGKAWPAGTKAIRKSSGMIKKRFDKLFEDSKRKSE
ncbi:MAG: hypothetical protein KAQ98_09125 [Bacteriovoracaceae bacterium]|nr:hypothetical protein [Bacteriovoracaceae bacterium]